MSIGGLYSGDVSLGSDRGSSRKIHQPERHAQTAGAALQEFPVGQHHDPSRQAPAREPNAEVRPDAGRLTRRYRNQRSFEF